MQYQDFSWIQTAFQMNFLLNTPELSTACVHHGEGAHSFVPAGPYILGAATWLSYSSF